MGRNLTAAVDAALLAGQVRGVFFVYLDFSSGVLRLCNAAVNVPWDGHTWLGVGYVGRISPIAEGANLESYGIELVLTGIPAAQVSIAMQEHYQGRTCKVWFAPLSADLTVIPEPKLIFHGRMNTMDVQLGETGEIRLSAESRLADWDRARIRRYNDADQQAEYAADRGMEFVELMADKTIYFGPRA